MIASGTEQPPNSIGHRDLLGPRKMLPQRKMIALTDPHGNQKPDISRPTLPLVTRSRSSTHTDGRLRRQHRAQRVSTPSYFPVGYALKQP